MVISDPLGVRLRTEKMYEVYEMSYYVYRNRSCCIGICVEDRVGIVSVNDVRMSKYVVIVGKRGVKKGV